MAIFVELAVGVAVFVEEGAGVPAGVDVTVADALTVDGGVMVAIAVPDGDAGVAVESAGGRLVGVAIGGVFVARGGASVAITVGIRVAVATTVGAAVNVGAAIEVGDGGIGAGDCVAVGTMGDEGDVIEAATLPGVAVIPVLIGSLLCKVDEVLFCPSEGDAARGVDVGAALHEPYRRLWPHRDLLMRLRSRVGCLCGSLDSIAWPRSRGLCGRLKAWCCAARTVTTPRPWRCDAAKESAVERGKENRGTATDRTAQTRISR